MQNAVFTIITKNYIGLANTLGNSLVLHNPNLNFYIFIADEFDEENNLIPQNGFKYITAKNFLDIDALTWMQMTFKYNLVEFCTAIKPFCFSYLINTCEHEKVIYFDPDILVFSSLNSIFESLDEYNVVLTPHILSMQEKFIGDLPEYAFLKYGIYNLGFLAVKKTLKVGRLLNWWGNRLIDYCFFDDEKGLATDQKWALFFPNFLSSSELLISTDYGLNVAPWNFFEREIEQLGNQLYVKDRNSKTDVKKPLVFVHFSSCNYNNILNDTFVFPTYADVKILFKAYKDGLAQADIHQYLHLQYSYKCFDNGVLISDFNRRLYRAATEEVNGWERNNNPFDTNEGSFYNQLKRQRLLSKQASNANNGHPSRNIQVDPKKGKQLIIMNFVSKLLLFVMGANRYAKFIINISKYFTYERQVHLLGNYKKR